MQDNQSVKNTTTYPNVAEGSALRASDLQIAKYSSGFAMEHKMGLAVINLAKNLKNVATKRYFVDASYYWDSYNNTSLNQTEVKPSGTFTSTSKPYGDSDIRYFVLDVNNNCTLTTSSSITVQPFNTSLSSGNADFGNNWTWTGMGTGNTVTNIDPTISTTYYSWAKHTVAIGQVLYSDGALSALDDATLKSSEYSGRRAIGLVFSITTSSTDQGHNWTHGYAWALQNSAVITKWQNNTTGTLVNSAVSGSSIGSDKDGYTRTQAFKTYANNNLGGLSTSNYAAVYYALNYSEPYPPNSSGWYLQSCGQQFDISVNLGGLSSTPDTSGDAWRWNSPAGTNTMGKFKEKLDILINAGRTNVTTLVAPTNKSTDNVGFYTSSESAANVVYEQYYVGYTDIYPFNKQSTAHHWMIRPVLAF